MPVLIILLYYINDLSKLKRYYDQTEFVAQQMVNILQNISQGRKTEDGKDDRKIKRNDIRRAAALAYLSIYPGKTMYYNGNGKRAHDLSHYPLFHIYYVKGLADGKASVIWGQSMHLYGSTPLSGGFYGVITSTDSDSKVIFGTNISSSIIFPSLKINEGEEKIIVECALYNGYQSMNSNEYISTTGVSITSRKAFKCFFATPKPNYPNADYGYYFNSVAIFTPAPGLFDETPPN